MTAGSSRLPQPDGGTEPLWDEVRMRALLAEPRPAHEHLFVAGCVANQGRFYPEFRAVVLLSVPLDVLLARIAGRDTNDFGKSPAERDKIIADVEAVRAPAPRRRHPRDRHPPAAVGRRRPAGTPGRP